MANAISYIGSTISCVVGVPATVDAAGFGALSYTVIGKVASWPPVGDTSAKIEVELLDGRKEYVAGIKDGGSGEFKLRYDSDAGQTILVANSNLNVEISFKILHPDGKIAYQYGKVSDVRDLPLEPGSYKGFTGTVSINSATIRV